MAERKFKKTGWLSIAVAALLLVFIAPALSAEKSKKRESTDRGYLGVTLKSMDRTDRRELKADFGVLIEEVVAGEAADKAGIMEDDVVQYVDKQKVRRPSELSTYILEKKPGAKVKLKVIRKGSKKELTAVLGERKHSNIFSFHRHPKELKELKKIKKKTRGYLGVMLRNFSDKEFADYFGVKDGKGALIERVEKDSPARKSGLKAGDVIIKYNNKKVESPSDVSKMAYKGKKGDKVAVTVMRHRKEKKITVTLGEKEARMHLRFFGEGGNNVIHEFFGKGDHNFNIRIPHMEKFHFDKDEDRVIIKELKGKKGKKKIIIRESADL